MNQDVLLRAGRPEAAGAHLASTNWLNAAVLLFLFFFWVFCFVFGFVFSVYILNISVWEWVGSIFYFSTIITEVRISPTLISMLWALYGAVH